MFLFNGCVESLALLGSTAGGAANGKLVQTSLKSAVSYGVKKQTGKSPLEHALTYAKEKNPDKKKERCISSIEKTNSEFCMIVKKQIKTTKANVAKKISSTQNNITKKISSTQTNMTKKISSTQTNTTKKISSTQTNVSKKTQVILDKTVEINSLTKLKNSSIELVSAIQDKILEYDARWLEHKKLKIKN
jgi:hypothetical protein